MPLASLPLTFDANGLLPVIVQDHLTGELRMFAFATQEAVLKTLETGRATFWSRSRGELWEKGRTSANPIRVHRVLVDCDADCIVYSGEPEGPSCHTGATSCFFQILQDGKVTLSAEQPQTVLAALESTLEARKKSTAQTSYTKSLYDAGPAAIGAKIREEAAELSLALEKETDDRVIAEAADTLYHVLVGLRARGIPVRRVLAELHRRQGTGGHEEKASRSKP
jgi:phosphoribosyl-ATP pyrophosphohydrolase/phosphoribosyl-AMP cyclohydrolase